MDKNLDYNAAFQQLEELVEQIEGETIPLDTLANKVKQANELITWCQDKLRVIEDDVKNNS